MSVKRTAFSLCLTEVKLIPSAYTWSVYWAV